MKFRRKIIGIKSIAPIWPVLLLTLLSGCLAVGPDYVRPDTPVYSTWNNRSENAPAGSETELARWWTALNDPVLSGLIERAEKGNRDLKKAEARIREARARRGAARGGYFPAVDASGSARWSRSSADTGGGATGKLFSAGFDAAWEIDIFGGVRRSVEAAQANWEASVEDRRDVWVSLLAEVALNYVDVRTYQARMAVARANLKSQEETYQLTVWRNQAGLSDELAVEQARFNLESTRSRIPALNTGLEEAMNRIAVLLGEEPGKISGVLEEIRPIPVASGNIAAGVPADILRRRPDIRKAERDLASQTAQVGVATAELYPKFKISGTLGVNASTFGNLFSATSHAYGFGPTITIPIFAGGSIRQNIEVQSAVQEQYLIAYESVILNALEEAENALAALRYEQLRRRALADAAAAAKEAARLARIKYESGLSDFTVVLDAERSLLSAQDELTQSEATVTADVIRVYKALGGGWQVAADDDRQEK